MDLEQRKSHYQAVAQTQLQISRVAELLERFHEAGIPVILLKGIALLGRVYATPGERTMGDVDLWVRRADLPRAEALAAGEGYAFTDEGRGFSPEFAREFLAQVPYFKGTVYVELHWHIVTMHWYRRTTAIDVDGVWERALPASAGGAPALRLAPEDELIHLCCHTAVQNSLVYFKGYRDIVRVLQTSAAPMDWARFVERARAWRVRTACWAALSVVSRLDEKAIPCTILDDLDVPRWRQALLRPFVAAALAGRPALVSGRMRFLGLLMIDRLRDLPGVLWQGLFPGRRWLRTRFGLSNRLAFWRQFSYPLEVLWRGAGALLKRRA